MDHIAFSVREIQPVFQKMKNNETAFIKELRTDGTYGFKNFFIRRPDGLLLEILEEKPIPNGIWD